MSEASDLREAVCLAAPDMTGKGTRSMREGALDLVEPLIKAIEDLQKRVYELEGRPYWGQPLPPLTYPVVAPDPARWPIPDVTC